MRSVFFLSLLISLSGVFGANVDFGTVAKSVNPMIHGGNVAPRVKAMGRNHEVEILRDLNFASCRTHDLTLHDGAEPIVDFHHIFPVFLADENDPASYRFAATDAAFAAITNAGMKVFYRLGHSAEGRGDDTAGGYFNNTVGDNTTAAYEKAAKVLSKIVAHYNEGWANGYHLGIEYWEIWNEPNNSSGDWPGMSRTTFATFFGKCVKQLKTDHPTIKVGGPALSNLDATWADSCLAACVNEGTLPDFLTWHKYGTGDAPTVYATQAATARAYLDNKGYTSMEIGMTEWNLVKNWNYSWKDTGRLTMEGASWCGAALTSMAYSDLDFAHWYGSGWDAGYGVYNGVSGQLNKTYYALKAFGCVMKDYTKLVSRTDSGNYNVLGAINADTLATATKGCIYVADRSTAATTVSVTLSGFTGKTLSNVKCFVVDTTRDFVETSDFTLATSAPTSLSLTKSDAKQAVWLVTFDLN